MWKMTVGNETTDYEFEFRVYETVGAMNRASNLLCPEDKRPCLAVCNYNGRKITLLFNVDSLDRGIVAHEIFHAVLDWAEHQCSCLCTLRHRGDNLEEAASLMKTLTDEFWSWWLEEGTN